MSEKIKQARRGRSILARLLCSVSFPAFALMALPSAAHAQALHWDGGTVNGGNPAAGANGGSGDWNTTTTNWDTAATGDTSAAWVNGANDAFFAGTAGTVTLREAITARDLNFSTHNYVLTGNSVNTLTLTAGADITVSSGDAATISAVLTGTNGLNKTPTGTLILGGTNTLTGGITVTGGALRLQGTNSANGANNVISVNTGATLQVNSSTAFGGDTAASRLQMETASAFEIMSNLTVAHDITLVEAGSLQIIGSGTWNGTVALNGDATLRFGAGTLTVNGNLSDNNGSVMGLEVIAGGSIVTFNGNLSHTGGFAMRDRAVLDGVNTYSGDTVVASGTANIATLTYMDAAAISANSNVVLGDALSVGLVGFGYAAPGITLGAGGGQFRFAGDGGFVSRPSTSGVDVVLTLNGGAGLTWGAGNFIGTGDTLYLGTNSTSSAAREIRLTNDIDLGAQQRTIYAYFGSIADHGVLSGVLSGTGGLQIVGNGLLELRGANAYTGATEVQSALMLGTATTIDTSNLQLNGISGPNLNDGIVVLTTGSGDFTRSLGTGANQVQWLSSGGFTAAGGARTVNIGNGAALTWNQGGFVGDGQRLVFGGTYGDSAIDFQNTIDLNGQNRTIEVNNITTNLTGLRLNGVISGNGGLIFDGSGDVVLTAANTFTGNAILGDPAGTSTSDDLEVTVTTIGNAGVAGNLGAGGTIELKAHNGVLFYTGTGETTDRNWIVDMRTSADFTLNNNGSGPLTLTGPITKGATGTTNRLMLGGTFNSTDTNGDGVEEDANVIAGVISENSGVLNVQLNNAVNTWRLTGDNTYGGSTFLNTGTLEVDDLANGGAASSIGNSSSAATNLFIGNSATLRYMGTGNDSTDRLMQILTTSRIESSGSGTVSFTNSSPLMEGGGLGSTYGLALGGTSTGENIFAPTLTNLYNATPAQEASGQKFGLIKDGSGLWALTADSNAHANAYTDNTTITGGALKLNHAGAITGGLGAVSTHGAAGSLERSSLILFNGTTTAGVLGLTAASGPFSRGLTTEADAFIDNNGTLNAPDDDNFIQGVRWTGSGGFAAWDGTQIVNIGGNATPDTLTWATGGFVPTGRNLVFGYVTATGTVDFQNPVSLTNAARTIEVNNGTASVDAVMSGAITSTTTAGALVKNGAGTLALTAANTYTGVTTINAGTLQLGNATATGNLGTGNVTVAAGATIAFNRNNVYSVANTISGAGTLLQQGTGTTTLAAASNSVGATQVSGGVLQVTNILTTPTIAMSGTSALTVNGTVQASGPGVAALTGDAGASTITVNGTMRAAGDLGDGADAVILSGTLDTGGGTLALGAGDDTLTLNDTGTFNGSIDAGAGTDTLQANNAGARTLTAASVPGFEALNKTLGGTLTLTGAHDFSAGTTIGAGVVQIGDGVTAGSINGNVVNNGALTFNNPSSYSFAGVISGSGSVSQIGAGTTILTANNSYTGPTNVNAGTLIIDGIQTGGGLFTVANGGTLGGNGNTGGAVSIANGGTLAPGGAGVAPGVLTVAGNLTLNSGSGLAYNFGQSNTVGGPFNDHTIVNGDLRLDGTLDMTVSPGGTFAPGFYRAFTYSGALDNQGLALGASVPFGVQIDTATAGQVNLLNTGGGTLNFWDSGTSGNHFDDTAQGGSGVWQSSGGNVNWTETPSNGASVNASWADATFAIFQGSAGTVTVDNFPAAVTAAGMQFRVNGYVIDGEPLTLVPLAPGANAVIRVGEGAATDASITATISTELTGAAGLTKTDGGRLILTGANTYTGTTVIEGGVIQVAAQNALGANSGLMLQGGTLNTTSSFTLGKDILLNGPGGVVEVNGGTTLTHTGAVSGTGSFTKQGAGRLNYTGTGLFGGSTTVAAGLLSVNGSLVNSAVTVQSGASLGGTGTVGATTVQSGGTIAPGNSIGTLNVNGAFTQASGSVYQVEVDPGTNASDLVAVTGTATLQSGSGLNVTQNPVGDYRVGTIYTVLTSTGGLSGTYALSGQTGTAFLALRDSYDANNAYLTVVQTQPLTVAVETPNDEAIVDALETLPPTDPVVTAVLNVPDIPAAQSAFDQLSASALASAKGALVANGLYVRDVSFDRLRDTFCEDEETISARPICSSRGLSLWAQGFGGWGGVSGNANAAGMNHSTAGFLVGFDLPVADWRVGMFGGRSQSDLHLVGMNARGESTDFHLGGYAGTRWDNISLRLGASYSWDGITADRNVAFGNFSDQLRSVYNAGTSQGFAELGYSMQMWETHFEPFANLAYINVRTDGFREVGGPAALTVRADTLENLVSTLGLRPSTSFILDGTDITLRGMAGWRHTFGTVAPRSTMAFAGGSDFTITGAPIGRDAVALEAGVNVGLSDNVSAGLTYGGQLSSRTTDQTVRGTIRISLN